MSRLISRTITFVLFLAGVAFLSDNVSHYTGWNPIFVGVGVIAAIVVVCATILIIGFFQVNEDYRILEGVADASKK